MKFTLITLALTVLSLGLVAPQSALANDDIEVRWGGHIQTGLRYRIEEKRIGEWYHAVELPEGVSRNENQAKLKLDILGEKWAAIVDVDLVYLGIADDVKTLNDLARRKKLDPFRIEPHALYIEAPAIFGDTVDLRVGYQKLSWGMGDQFNPTNNMNADDVEDALLFGDQQANAMARVDWMPDDRLQLTFALVPVFRPAHTPASGELGLAAIERLPFEDEFLRHRINAEQAAAEGMGAPTIVNAVEIKRPKLTFENMQFAFQIEAELGQHDVALSYFVGHHDYPLPSRNHVSQSDMTVCPPWYDDLGAGHGLVLNGTSPCTMAMLGQAVTLEYPRMQVLGFNMAGELDVFSWMDKDALPLGYRFELGVFFPEERRIAITQDALNFVLPSGIPLGYPAMTYAYPGSTSDRVLASLGFPQDVQEPLVLNDRPFAKWALGLDYTLGDHVMLNFQWVHGMVDEFGSGDWINKGYTVRASSSDTDLADTIQCGLVDQNGTKCAREVLRSRLGDYIVAGVDVNFLNNRALFRLFSIWDLTGVVMSYWDVEKGQRVKEFKAMYTKEGFSAVIYPSFSYQFGHGLSASAGALVKLGRDWSKFGDPAAGGSVVYANTRYAF